MEFRDDKRGITPQIGFLLVFAILVFVFAGYQAEIVSNQNEDVEFEHNEQVQKDMLEVRNAILEAKVTGADTFAEVQLGTQFPPRLVALNPSHPTGTLRTTDARAVTVTEDGGDGDEIEFRGGAENRFIEYEPQYSVYRNAGTLRYENTVLYHEFETSNVPLSDQRLLRDDTVSLLPVQREFSASGRSAVSVEPVPGSLETMDVEDPVVIVPTELDESDWERLLATELEADDEFDADDVTVSDGELEVTLTGVYEIEYAPVGFNRSPESGGRGDDSTGINPAAPGDIRFVTEFFDPEKQTSSEVLLRFENTADATDITDARINFYHSADPRGQDVSRADFSSRDGDVSGTLEFREPFVDLDPRITIDGGTTTDLRLNFYDEEPTEDPNLASGSWLVLSVQLETGQQATYFVPIPEDDNEPGTFWTDIEETNSPIEEGDTLDVDVEIENTGDVEDAQTIELEIEDLETASSSVVDEADVELDGGEIETITLQWETTDGDAGEYNATVLSDNDFDTVDVEVEANSDSTTESGDPQGTVDLEDGIREGDDEFDVSVTFENTDEAHLVVENEQAEEKTFELEEEGDVTVIVDDEFSLTADEDVTATLYESNDEENVLNADTTTVDAVAMADLIERVDGSTNVQGNDRPQFDFIVEEDNVTVSAAAIETRNDFEEIDANEDSTFVIGGEESTEATDTDGNFVYEFGSEAVFDEDDGDVRTEFDKLDTQIENLEFVDEESEADLVIALEFQDDSVKEFYLEGEVR